METVKIPSNVAKALKLKAGKKSRNGSSVLYDVGYDLNQVIYEIKNLEPYQEYEIDEIIKMIRDIIKYVKDEEKKLKR